MGERVFRSRAMRWAIAVGCVLNGLGIVFYAREGNLARSAVSVVATVAGCLLLYGSRRL